MGSVYNRINVNPGGNPNFCILSGINQPIKSFSPSVWILEVISTSYLDLKISGIRVPQGVHLCFFLRKVLLSVGGKFRNSHKNGWKESLTSFDVIKNTMTILSFKFRDFTLEVFSITSMTMQTGRRCVPLQSLVERLPRYSKVLGLSETTTTTFS